MQIRISYSPYPYEIGTVREVPDDEARLLIREGRAVEWYGEDAPPETTSAVPAYDVGRPLGSGATTFVNTTGQPEQVTKPPKAKPTE